MTGYAAINKSGACRCGEHELALGGQHEPAQLLREIARDDMEPGAADLTKPVPPSGL